VPNQGKGEHLEPLWLCKLSDPEQSREKELAAAEGTVPFCDKPAAEGKVQQHLEVVLRKQKGREIKKQEQLQLKDQE